MKSSVLLIISIILLALSASSQDKVNITGAVKDAAGNAVPFTFIKNVATKQAAYSDSSGNFKFSLLPNSILQFAAPGYTDERVNIGTNTVIQVTLKGNGTKSQQPSSDITGLKSLTADGYSERSNQNFTLTPGSLFFKSKKEDTKGSPYLFNYWVHGFVITPLDSITQNFSYLFNYDMLEGKVLLLQENKTIGIVSDAQIKKLYLFDNNGEQYELAIIPSVDKAAYTRVLADGKNYTVYKLVKTHLDKADFVDNGVTSRGKKYDEYVDETAYYILNKKNQQIHQVALKKKSFKAAFPDDAEKVNKYLSAHNDGDIDDFYLTSLVDTLNN